MTLHIEAIEPGVIRLAFSNWRGRAVGYEVSAYLIDGVLVDTGFLRVSGELAAAVASLSPRGVIVTHWHEDHAGNVARLAAAGISMRMHPACEAALRERPAIRFYRQFVWGRNPRLNARLRDFDPAPLQVIPTPGHTEDHVVVWDAERRIVASGDLFLGVKVRVAHPHESPLVLVQSLRRVMALEPRVLLDAHRGVVRDPVPMLAAKIAWMEETMGEIIALAGTGASEREIQHRVLGRETLVGWVSRLEYSKRAFVRSVLQNGASG
ncbi:MAG: MBL fold metallo-hydrolase [Gemmatimonadota bacterium]|nr:MBL fold metallo-hydrolase [Gemmatimonadota bacterium]